MLLIKIFVELRVVAGRSRMRAGSPQAVSRRPCCTVALEERHGQRMAWARHGHGMTSVNQTRPHCVNQMGKTHSKPLAARHGRGTAWARHGHGMGTACYGWIGLSCADCLEIWELNPPGNLRACPGLYRDCFPTTFYTGRNSDLLCVTHRCFM